MLASGDGFAFRNSVSLAALAVVLVLGVSTPASAQSLLAALANAYGANPTLNAARANARAVDEGVPAAIGGSAAVPGFRPRVSASGDVGASSTTTSTPPGRKTHTELLPGGMSLTVNQLLYNGNRTQNSIRQAESAVFAAREVLRNTEQQVLFDSVSAYMNVVFTTSVQNLRENNVNVLSEQVRQTKDRFNVGEVTRTDVALSEARLAGSRADLARARADVRAAQATFKQVIGMDPKKVANVQPVDRKRLPKTQGDAVQRALRDHPSISAALHGVDVQQLAVKVVEGELLPTVGIQGSLSRRYDTSTNQDRRNSASVVGTLSVPIFDGGGTYARVRAAKETLGERRLNVDAARDLVLQSVVASWSAFEATGFQIEGAQAQVQAATIALNGVREESRVGQRTVLDVLNAEQELLNARLQLVTAQRDRVVQSYALLRATGQLSARSLGLKVANYDPKVHYEQVRDKWMGLRTPSGE
jgi:outer membrane protein